MLLYFSNTILITLFSLDIDTSIFNFITENLGNLHIWNLEVIHPNGVTV